MTDKEIHYTDSIHFELEQTARLMRMLTVQLFIKLEIQLSIDEYAALDTIFCHDGICQRDLAKLILKDRANTGRILNSLEEKGLITRYIDTKNNRLVKKMNITEQGTKELKIITAKFNEYLSGMTQKFRAKEVDAVRDTLRKFRMDLEQLVYVNI